jgi:transmembrane sensor
MRLGRLITAPYRMLRAEQIDAAARRWFVRVHSGAFSNGDNIGLQEWLKDNPAHAEAFRRVSGTWHRLGAAATALRASPGPVGVPLKSGRWPAPAAAFGCLMTVALTAVVFVNISTAPVPAGRYATDVGEVTDIRLADNSQIKLGARSEVEVDVTKDRRVVHLTDGEAYFDVAPDPAHPFTVETKQARIRVLGTRFYVHTGPDGVSVTVAEGHVAVENNTMNTAEKVPLLSARLQKGERVEVDKKGDAFNVSAVDVSQAMAWQYGRLEFQNASLSTVVADLNRYSRKSAVIADDRIRDLRVTGMFRAGDFESVIESITETLPVRAETNGATGVTLRSAESP